MFKILYRIIISFIEFLERIIIYIEVVFLFVVREYVYYIINKIFKILINVEIYWIKFENL